MTIRAGHRPCTVTVCRGCCCGTARKHPGTDHDGQLRLLRQAAAAGDLVVRTTDCLDACLQSNVIVIQPSTQGRIRGGRPLWLGWALDEDCTAHIIEYAAAGGPGIADLPAALDLHRITPPRVPSTAGTRR